jgi:catechol 2,3-dioxygenase-like lactoylglutathione lyase family enzyme
MAETVSGRSLSGVGPGPEPPLLDTGVITAFISTAHPERARGFYAGTLGLRLVSEDAFAIVCEVGGIELRIAKVGDLAPQPFTVLGWRVTDAAATVRALGARGVTFERYPFLTQDADGVWDAPGGARVAWFKDPDGNLLSVHQAGQ